MQIIKHPGIVGFLPAFFKLLEERVVERGYDEAITARLLPAEDDEDAVIEFSSPTCDFPTLTICVHEWVEKNSCTCVYVVSHAQRYEELDIEGGLIGEFLNQVVAQVTEHFFINRPFFYYAVGVDGILIQQRLAGECSSAVIPYTDTFLTDAVDMLARQVPKIEYNRRLGRAFALANAGDVDHARCELQYTPLER